MKQEEGTIKYYIQQWPQSQQSSDQLYHTSSGYLRSQGYMQDTYYSMPSLPWNYEQTMSYPYSMWQQSYLMHSFCSQQPLKTVNPSQTTAEIDKEVTQPVQKKKSLLIRRQRKSSKRTKKNLSNYYWSAEENRRYSQYLRINPLLHELTVTEKKNMRVNVMMSRKVKTRTPQQCHSHHQKMMKKFGSIESIIEAMQGSCSDLPRRVAREMVPELVIQRSQVKAEQQISQC